MINQKPKFLAVSLDDMVEKMNEKTAGAGDLFKGLVPDLSADVEQLERQPKTCMNHYDKYLSLIRDVQTFAAFLYAGANPDGVMAAARINGVLS